MNKQKITFGQNFDDCIVVLKSAAQWRTDNKIAYSPIWDPEKVSKQAYLEEFYDFQAYVLYYDGVPIATATLADPSKKKLDRWDKVLGEQFKCTNCLYLDDLAVMGDKIGQGIFGVLLKEIEKFAIAGEYKYLRLDCDAGLEKLIQTYKKYGFNEVCKKDMGYRVTMFMEKLISKSA